MTYEIYDFNSRYRTNHKTGDRSIDPRSAIVKHIGWTPNTISHGAITEWRTPEPINYNRAVVADRPLDCEFVRDGVFFRDEETGKWWSVFLVPREQSIQFKHWADQQPIDFFWYHSRPPALRQGKKLLFNNKKAVDITVNERLYQLDYYQKFAVKYFAGDQTIVRQQLGPIRDRVLADSTDSEQVGVES